MQREIDDSNCTPTNPASRAAIQGRRQKEFPSNEAHNLKNVATARTKAAARLNRRFTLSLTGTPVENNVSEYYSVLTASVPGIFGQLKDFKERYRKEPQRTLRRATPFVLRRTKEKILKELPKKEEHELFLEMSPVQKEIYSRTVSEVREEVAAAYEDRPEQPPFSRPPVRPNGCFRDLPPKANS